MANFHQNIQDHLERENSRVLVHSINRSGSNVLTIDGVEEILNNPYPSKAQTSLVTSEALFGMGHRAALTESIKTVAAEKKAAEAKALQIAEAEAKKAEAARKKAEKDNANTGK